MRVYYDTSFDAPLWHTPTDHHPAKKSARNPVSGLLGSTMAHRAHAL